MTCPAFVKVVEISDPHLAYRPIRLEDSDIPSTFPREERRWTQEQKIHLARVLQGKKEQRVRDHFVGDLFNEQTRRAYKEVLWHEWRSTLGHLDLRSQHILPHQPLSKTYLQESTWDDVVQELNYDPDIVIDDATGSAVFWDSFSSSAVNWKEIRKETLAQESKRRLRTNLLIKVRSRHDPLRQDCSPQEMQARLLLRDLLSERDWRRYCTNGFIMVRGSSGKWYQIFQNQRRTNVYENGKLTHSLCIHTDRVCPPTDHLINLKTMVELDEPAIWKLSNVSLRTSNSDLGDILRGTLRDMGVAI